MNQSNFDRLIKSLRSSVRDADGAHLEDAQGAICAALDEIVDALAELKPMLTSPDDDEE